MSWKDRCLAFVKKYGKAAKVVAGGVLNVVAPGSGALVTLVEQACDKANDVAQDHWERALLQATQNNTEQLQRLGQLFELLSGDLGKLCDEAFAHKDRPDDLPDILRRTIAADPSLGQVLRHLQTLTSQFAAVQNELKEIKDILKNFKPGVSYENEEERAFLRQQREKFRKLPRDRQKAADWSNLADRLSEAGLFDLAREEHENAAHAAQQENNQALAAAEHFKAYRAACEKERWAAALASLRQAVELQPQLAPFDWEQYEPLEILGAGGFGTVFKCRDRNVHQHVAIKAIHTGDLTRGIQEVFKEAVLLTSLKHAAIIGVQTGRFADAAKQRPYIIMEYFPSQSLAARLKRGPLPVAEFLGVVRPVAEALRAAHHAQPQPIYHRDVKPDNVLVGAQGQVKVIDFGLAVRVAAAMKSTSTDPQRRTQRDQSYAGTLRYAPPEQKGESSAPVGPYSDIYGFGRSCCELLFGIPDLNEHPTKPQRHHYNRTEEPVPSELVALLKWCLQPIPEDRPQDFEEVLEVLNSLQKLSSLPPPPAPPVSAVAGAGPVAPTEVRAGQLRAALWRDPGNRELRKAYLAHRSTTLAQADGHAAAWQLASARALKVLLGFALFGVLGGLASWGFVVTTGQAIHEQVGLAIVLGAGSALLGAGSFAALVALGRPIPMEDLFVTYKDAAEKSKASARSALGRALAWLAGLIIDLIGGVLWGAVCGLAVGVLGGVTSGVVGVAAGEMADLTITGVNGGALLGLILAGVVILRRQADVNLVAWAELGPLPWSAYLLGLTLAWKKYQGQ